MLAAYWVMDSVDRCHVGFTSWHLVMNKDKFDGTLAQVTEVYTVDDTSNEKRQNVYKNFGFAKAVLIFEVGNMTKELELECNKATRLNKKTIHNNGGGRIKEATCRKN